MTDSYIQTGEKVMKKLLVEFMISDTYNGTIPIYMEMDVPDDADEADIHAEAYKQFRELPVDVEDFEEIFAYDSEETLRRVQWRKTNE